MFISFEGIDGSGKTTQIERLAACLEQQGHQVLKTRDPGGTPLGQQLREILLHHPGYVSPRCEMFLYLADRAQHVDEKIRPALDAGTVVLIDRYIDSTAAYQGGGRGISMAEINRMNAIATHNLKPDRTFLFDAPVELLLHRARSRNEADRLESETVSFYQSVREHYLELAKAEPERFVILDAAQSPDAVFDQMMQALPDCLIPKALPPC